MKNYKSFGYIAALVALMPLISFAKQINDLEDLAAFFQLAINAYIIPGIFALALVYFLWGVYQYVQNPGKGLGDLKDKVLWGVIGLACMVSVWGLVRLVTNTFTLQGVDTPIKPPTFHL